MNIKEIKKSIHELDKTEMEEVYNNNKLYIFCSNNITPDSYSIKYLKEYKTFIIKANNNYLIIYDINTIIYFIRSLNLNLYYFKIYVCNDKIIDIYNVDEKNDEEILKILYFLKNTLAI